MDSGQGSPSTTPPRRPPPARSTPTPPAKSRCSPRPHATRSSASSCSPTRSTGRLVAKPRRSATKRRFLWKKFPKFVLGFLLISLLATLGYFTKPQLTSLANLSRWAFLLTFAGVGLSTSLRELGKQGWKPFAVGAIGEVFHRAGDPGARSTARTTFSICRRREAQSCNRVLRLPAAESAPPDPFDLSALDQVLCPALPSPIISAFFRPSLRPMLSPCRRPRLARAHGLVCFADEQTAGRGRGAHTWQSPPSSGLYVSVLLRPKIAPADVLWLSLAAGLAVREAVRQVTSLEADLRWPNDLLLGPKKFCGILTELNAEVTRVRHLVVGIGINVHQERFPEELHRQATSLLAWKPASTGPARTCWPRCC